MPESSGLETKHASLLNISTRLFPVMHLTRTLVACYEGSIISGCMLYALALSVASFN
jgi:hypothetical protein